MDIVVVGVGRKRGKWIEDRRINLKETVKMKINEEKLLLILLKSETVASFSLPRLPLILLYIHQMINDVKYYAVI